MEELKVGASFLRSLNTHALERLEQKIVVHAEGVPVAVVMPWSEHERLVGLAPVVIDRTPEVSPELRAQVEQILSGVEHLLTLEGMMEALVRYVTEIKPPGHAPATLPSVPPPHLVNCLHCGERKFGVTKFATVCSECKSVGHTSPPEECPPCTEGKAI